MIYFRETSNKNNFEALKMFLVELFIFFIIDYILEIKYNCQKWVKLEKKSNFKKEYGNLLTRYCYLVLDKWPDFSSDVVLE